MSTAFVPGRILLMAPLSSLLVFSSPEIPAPEGAFSPGDFGPICTSGNGGGLGRRGELKGDLLPVACVDAIVARVLLAVDRDGNPLSFETGTMCCKTTSRISSGETFFRRVLHLKHPADYRGYDDIRPA